jgi:ABC-type branched-subunit amino acid transport system ATPase component
MSTPEILRSRSRDADAKGQSGGLLLQARGIRKSFGKLSVLDHVDLDLHLGELVLLRGDNGSGKTTLLNILTGNLEPDAGELMFAADGTPESFHFPRRWWQNLNPFDHFTPERVAGEQIGRAWQDIRLFRTLSVGENLLVAAQHQSGELPINVLFRPSHVARQERDARVQASSILLSLGLETLDARGADQISLGQSKRAAIARAIQADARILFLDEPLSGLDENGIEQILQFLSEIRTRHELTIVIVEHSYHIPRLLKLADTVWTMRNGNVVAEPVHEVRIDREAETFISTLARVLGPDRTAEQQWFAGGSSLTNFSNKNTRQDRPALEVHNWSVKRGSRTIIGSEPGGMNFALHRGSIAVLQAPNGWGKTTLAESLTGLLPGSGTVVLREHSIEGLPPWERAQLGLNYVQSRNRLFPSLTVREALRLSGSGTQAIAPHLLDRPMNGLSGGERQRVFLALAFATPNTSALILDEPINMLDEAGMEELYTSLRLAEHLAILILVPASPKLDN